MDPNRQREEWEKGSRDPSLAIECAWVKIRGTKEPKPGGGLRWTVDARYREYDNYAQSGMEAARRAVYLRELSLHGRTMQVFIVPVGRQGCLKRNKLFTNKQKKARAKRAAQAMNAAAGVGQGIPVTAKRLLAEDDEMTAEQALDGVRLFDHPSRRTLFGSIIPTCQLIFSAEVDAMLNDPTTVRIGLCCDFAKSKGFSCMGGVVTVFQEIKAFEDPRGGIQRKTIAKSFKLPMVQSTNKVTRKLVDSEGGLLTPQAAKCLAKALLVGNAARHFIEHPEMWTITNDGATENCGLSCRHFATEAAVRDDFCGVGGLYSELVITKRAWPDVVNGAKEAGLLDPLDDFFGHSDFKWPGTQIAEQSAGAGEAGSFQAPLDRNGPVHKDPKVVQHLSGLYVEATDRAKREAHEETVSKLRDQVSVPRPVKVYGPFRDVDERLKRQQAAEDRESKFQRILSTRRQRAFSLYQERISLLKHTQQTPQSMDMPVSMEHNPLRFVPGRCACNGNLLGEVRHCSCHRGHNLTEDFVSPLNEGFLEQCVSTATYVSSEYRWLDLRAAINFLLVPALHEEIKGKSGFYSAVKALLLEVMTLETLIEQCAFDIKKGAQPPQTAGIARWGSALAAAGSLDEYSRLLAFGIIKKYSLGTPEAKTNACADVLLGTFASGNYQNLQIESHAERHFALLTRTSDLLQLGIASFVNDIVEMPLLAALSSDHECGLAAMGAESAIRAIVFAVTRDIWVRCFPHGDWGLGWNRKTTLMFRSIAEFNPEASVLFLNPRCEDAVRRRFSDLQSLHPNLVDKAAKAVTRLVSTIERLARNDGPMLPEDSQKRWAEANPKMAELIAKIPGQDADSKHTQFYEGNETYAARVSQAQWLVLQTVRASAEALCNNVRGMHRELYGVSGWIANMGKSQRSDRVQRVQMPGGKIEESPLVIPGNLSLPNAVNAYVQARDLLAHYEGKGISRDELVKCLPTYCQWWLDVDQIRDFINQTVGSDSQDGPRVIDTCGAGYSKAQECLLKPLSCFPQLDQCSAQASACINNSKVVESSFSPMKVIGRSKGIATFAFLSMLYMKHNFRTALLNAEKIITGDKDRYWKAQGVASLPGWDWVNMRDDVLGDIYRDADLEDKLQNQHKRVARGGNFQNPRHGGSSRTKKYRGGQARVSERGKGAGRGRKRARVESEVSPADPSGGAGTARRGRSGRKRARVGSDESAANPGGGAASRGRSCGRRGGGVGRGGGGGSGGMARQNHKRHGASVDSDLELPATAKRVRAAPPSELRGDRIAPQISRHLSSCLSAMNTRIDKKRRRQMLDEIQKVRAERSKLAELDESQKARAERSKLGGSHSDDDSDYCPDGSSIQSNEVSSRILRGSASKQALAQTTTFDPLAACDDHDAEQSGSSADSSSDPADKPAAAAAAASQAAKAPGPRAKRQSGPCASQPPRGRGGSAGRGGGGPEVSARWKAREGAGRGRVPKATGDRGALGSAQANSKSPVQGDQSEDSSEEDNVPLSRRQAVVAEARAAVVADARILNATAQPPVGAKVDIKWDPTKWPERGGWSKARVTAISDGRLPAPGRCKRKIVEAGYSVVEYDNDKNRYVHLLDEAHHVSILGDLENAWRLVSSSDDAHEVGSGACRDAGSASLRGEEAADEDDDVTVFAVGTSLAPPAVGAAADSGPILPMTADAPDDDIISAGGARAGAAPVAAKPVVTDIRSRKPPNVWSRAYCFDVFQKLSPGQFRLGVAKHFAGSYNVTRQMPTKGRFPKEADITIHVTTTSRVCYIAYTEETGPTLFMVTQITRPRDSDWSNTLRGYQMFTTEQALARVDVEPDTQHLGCATSLGAVSLRKELTVDKSSHQMTYHPTDWEVSMDVRRVVGVVRRAQDTQRKTYDRTMHASWPAKTSLIFTGLPYSESH
jgi:hypothetical protein